MASVSAPPSPATQATQAVPAKQAILFSGASGHGKDASASILVRDAAFSRFALADPLRACALEVWQTMLVGVFGLVPASHVTYETFSEPSQKDEPLRFQSVERTSRPWSAPYCAECERSHRSPYVCVADACGHDLFPTPLGESTTALVPLRGVYVDTPLLLAGFGLSRAVLAAWLGDLLARHTGGAYDPECIAAASCEIFEACADAAARIQEPPTRLPPSDCGVAKLGVDASNPALERAPHTAVVLPAADVLDCNGATESESGSLAAFWNDGRLVVLQPPCLEAMSPRAPTLAFAMHQERLPSVALQRSAESPPVELMFRGRTLTPRVLLQWLGTDICRVRISPSLWIDTLLRRVALSGARRIAVTDMRFGNESFEVLAGLREQGFDTKRVRVVDPTAPPQDGPVHVCEQMAGQLPVDATIYNAKELGWSVLEAQVHALYRSLFPCPL
jgi:hypothetical protein